MIRVKARVSVALVFYTFVTNNVNVMNVLLSEYPQIMQFVKIVM